MINTKEYKKGYKSVLCLDGDIPLSFIRNTNLPVIATDGAANELLRRGICPTVVIGDLDSINDEVRSNCNCIKIDSQDTTDYEKALSYINENDLGPTMITGIGGGYLDRIIMNLSTFYQHNSMLVAEDLIGMVVSGRREMNLPRHTKISVLGMDEAIVTSRGLKWDMDETRLSFSGISSGCNRVAKENVILEVKGKIFVFIYLKDIEDAGR
jgi:thiamine pyrophosphokinase